ncbi:glycosyltransferase [Maribellus sediminis]|uniref:glycosyltransferase n=1 Tax=Maribellus sediminis TaxID=2696285 RepID=UPI0014300851|nr:glycosyltransferase [Maribellus sediminis]
MKKLLAFHPTIAPYRIDLFNNLNKRFDANFYFYSKNLISQKFDQSKIIKQLDFNPKFLTNGFILKIKNKIRIIRFGQIIQIIKHKPEIVICIEYHPLTVISILFIRLFTPKIKVYTICDDSYEIVNNVGLLRKIARYVSLKYIDGLILGNEETEKWYNNNFREVNTITFPIIQDENRLYKILKDSNTYLQKYISEYKLEDKVVLLYVGRLAPEKNLYFLIEVFSYYAKNKPNVVLIIVGEGTEKESLIRFAHNQGIHEKIIFAGRFEHTELYAWYLVADCFVLPSTYEPFGAVVNEALIAGIPVLCTRSAGASVLINSKNGATFDPHNKKELEKLLAEFLIKKSTKRNSISDSRMPYTFKDRMDGLIKFLNL